ncbi:MAG: hypothetical protein KA941_12585 [Flavobacteriales bacterium]|nr:hypothetical protein [Flavobacteriales bacterium]
MITPTMTPLEVARDARQDLRAIWNKVKGTCASQERRHRTQRDRNCILETHLHWRSPRGNNWLLVLRTNRKETTIGSMVWYRGRDERLRAVHVALVGESAIYFSAHLLERYMERFDPSRNPIQRLGDFFFANHSLVTHVLQDHGNGQQDVMAGLVHGLATGVGDTTTKLISLTTFLDYGLLGDDQLKLAEMLDFHRELQTYPAGFRAHVLRMIEEERKKAA